MIPRYQLVAHRVQEEIAELERAVGRVEKNWRTAEQIAADQDVYVDSVALNLHSFYSGLERLFEYIAHQLDDGPPRGSSWHQELVQQMTVELRGARPAIITSQTADDLDEFRRFRHLVRNVYAEHLDPDRIGQLVSQLAELWPRLRVELNRFALFIQGASDADDTLA